MKLVRAAKVAAILGLVAACGQEAPPVAGLSGGWESGPVVLERGDFTETYRFTVTIDGPSRSGSMDITYSVTDQPATGRTLRQDLDVTVADGAVVLAGANPVLVSGPQFVGEYEPDVLYCSPPNVAETLDCGWGSDAHGEAPRILLRRR